MTKSASNLPPDVSENEFHDENIKILEEIENELEDEFLEILEIIHKYDEKYHDLIIDEILIKIEKGEKREKIKTEYLYYIICFILSVPFRGNEKENLKKEFEKIQTKYSNENKKKLNNTKQ